MGRGSAWPLPTGSGFHPSLGKATPQGPTGLGKRLLVLRRPYTHDPSAAQSKLCRRMENPIKELLVFVSDPRVPPDNNAAERSLRHLAVSRKVSGGARSR